MWIERQAQSLVRRMARQFPATQSTSSGTCIWAAEGKRVKEKMIVCRTRAAYKLGDGTWVVSVADALKRLAAR